MNRGGKVDRNAPRRRTTHTWGTSGSGRIGDSGVWLLLAARRLLWRLAAAVELNLVIIRVETLAVHHTHRRVIRVLGFLRSPLLELFRRLRGLHVVTDRS